MKVKFTMTADVDPERAGEMDSPPLERWTPLMLMPAMTDDVINLETASLSVEVLVP